MKVCAISEQYMKTMSVTMYFIQYYNQHIATFAVLLFQIRTNFDTCSSAECINYLVKVLTTDFSFCQFVTLLQ